MKTKDVTPQGVKAGPDDGLKEGEFTAYASVFGNVDSYGDKVMPGAFAEDLKRWKDSDSRIPLLFGHNMSDPDFNLGYADAVEDEHGLKVTGHLDLDNPKAAQVYRMLKGRRVNQMSFAYDVVEGSMTKEEDEQFYELRKLKLYEVSLVHIGANQETEVLSVKAAVDALASKTRITDKTITELSAVKAQLATALEALINVLPADGEEQDHSKASDTPAAKLEEPAGAKSEEQPANSPVETWHMTFQLLDRGEPS